MKYRVFGYVSTAIVLSNSSLVSSFGFQVSTHRTKLLSSSISTNSNNAPLVSTDNFGLHVPRGRPASLLLSHSNLNGDDFYLNRRKAPNNRVAIRWVIEAIEKILQSERKEGKISSRGSTIDDDNALIDALRRMQNARSKKAAIENENAMLVLEIEKNYSYAIQERVMKAVSMGGYVKLSLQIMNSMIIPAEGSNTTSPYIPSAIAYTSVFNRLRKWKKVDTMRETLENLSLACQVKGEILDVVVFNTYLAALCDTMKSKKVEDVRIELIDEALQLLDHQSARDKYSFPDPNVMSFNTVLNAAAEIKNQTMIEDIIDTMKQRDIVPDIVTYNALLKEASTPSEKMDLINEIRSFPGIGFDKYTVELTLLSFVSEGLISEMLDMLKEFCVLKEEEYILSNAFSTFLLTLVKGGEIDAARAIFDVCILPATLEKCDSTKTLLNSIGYVEKDSDADLTRVKALSRHFNALFEGYRSLENPHKWTKETNSVLLPKEQCSILYDHMKSMNVAPDSYTITILMGLRRKPDEITEFWNNVMERTVIDIESPVYHSLLTAYGKAGDGASACCVFDKMIGSCNLHPNLNSWNILLSALNKASSQHPDLIFDCETCSAAKLKFESEIINEKPFSGKDFIDIVNGLTAPQASKRILDLMNEARENSEISDLVLAPTSQAFCLVASALSHSRSIDPKGALDLYHNSVDNGLSIDGRFLNAIIRCYGDDISEALLSWKTVYRPAILASAPQKSNPSPSTMKKSRLEKNLIAGYHGLLYVAGKSYRPDIALRIAYAMSKEGVEPTEAALNTYNSGARLRDQGKERVRLHGQYENLLLVECAKYDSRDRRRLNEKRLRIII